MYICLKLSDRLYYVLNNTRYSGPVYTGQKSDYPLSPACTPRLFSFTISLERTAAENSLQRYESGKQRNERKELLH